MALNSWFLMYCDRHTVCVTLYSVICMLGVLCSPKLRMQCNPWADNYDDDDNNMLRVHQDRKGNSKMLKCGEL